MDDLKDLYQSDLYKSYEMAQKGSSNEIEALTALSSSAKTIEKWTEELEAYKSKLRLAALRSGSEPVPNPPDPKASLYKTVMCKYLPCRFGDSCKFAHSPSELRSKNLRSDLTNEEPLEKRLIVTYNIPYQ